MTERLTKAWVTVGLGAVLIAVAATAVVPAWGADRPPAGKPAASEPAAGLRWSSESSLPTCNGSSSTRRAVGCLVRRGRGNPEVRARPAEGATGRWRPPAAQLSGSTARHSATRPGGFGRSGRPRRSRRTQGKGPDRPRHSTGPPVRAGPAEQRPAGQEGYRGQGRPGDEDAGGSAGGRPAGRAGGVEGTHRPAGSPAEAMGPAKPLRRQERRRRAGVHRAGRRGDGGTGRAAGHADHRGDPARAGVQLHRGGPARPGRGGGHPRPEPHPPAAGAGGGQDGR